MRFIVGPLPHSRTHACPRRIYPGMFNFPCFLHGWCQGQSAPFTSPTRAFSLAPACAAQPSLSSPPSHSLDYPATFGAALELDVGNLVAYDPADHAIGKALQSAGAPRGTAPTRAPPPVFEALATAAAQSLVDALWALPSVPAPVGRVVTLPQPTTALPRAQPPPAPRPPTRWEAFAAKKGITKTKRSKLVWDEGAGDWKRRHGYKRAGDDADVVVVDARPGEDVTGAPDPFGEAVTARKERVAANRAAQVANLKSAAKAAGNGRSGPLALPPTLRLAASLSKHGTHGPPTKRKALRCDLAAAAARAGVSTASSGKFDGGVDAASRVKALAGTRRRYDPVSGGADVDVARPAAAVDRILRANADDLVNAPLAASRLEEERRTTGKKVSVDASADPDAPPSSFRRGKVPARRSKAGRGVGVSKQRGLPPKAASGGRAGIAGKKRRK